MQILKFLDVSTFCFYSFFLGFDLIFMYILLYFEKGTSSYFKLPLQEYVLFLLLNVLISSFILLKYICFLSPFSFYIPYSQLHFVGFDLFFFYDGCAECRHYLSLIIYSLDIFLFFLYPWGLFSCSSYPMSFYLLIKSFSITKTSYLLLIMIFQA